MEKSSSKKISPKVIGVWRYGSAIGFAFLLALPVIYYSIFGFRQVHLWILLTVSALCLAVWLLNVVILPPLQWKRWRYSINQYEIGLLRGVLVQTETLIPLSRVQHVDTRQGPVLRWYGLASVTISTAATTHEIPGLDAELADRLRRRISTYARLADDDV
ncbi:MAG: PH domain-containing protein [Balneolaceae bacterium]